MRCQQSPRVHSGTSSRIRLIASRFLAGPCLIPAISNRSMAANCLLGLFPFCPGALGIAQPHCRQTRIVTLCRATMRNAHRARAVLTINPERSWLRLSTRCHVRGPALPYLDEGAPDTQHGRDDGGAPLSSVRLPMPREAAWPLL